MRFKNKLQLLALILTALVFSSQELEHLMFHNCVESHSYYSYDSKVKHSPEINDFTGSIHKIFNKCICLACNSINGKLIAQANIQVQFTTLYSLEYYQSHESFSFNSYRKHSSRGPPSA